MKVLIIGAGRMGSALAHRSVARGHNTLVLCRSARSRTIRALPKKARVEVIATAASTDADLVLVAAPAWADRSKEALIAQFLDRIDRDIPVCSAAAYSGVPSAMWAAGRPFAKFMCSPAVANTRYKPLVILEAMNRRARVTFEKWLGPAHLKLANAQSFERLCTIFIATALHCEMLCRVNASLPSNLSPGDKRVSAETLLEAFSLLETFDFDPAAAFAACLTPRGRTLATTRKFFRA